MHPWSSRSHYGCGSQWASCRGTIWLAWASPGVPWRGLGEVGKPQKSWDWFYPHHSWGMLVCWNRPIIFRGFWDTSYRWFSRRIYEASTVLSFDTTRVLVPEWMHWRKLVPSSIQYQGSNPQRVIQTTKSPHSRKFFAFLQIVFFFRHFLWKIADVTEEQADVGRHARPPAPPPHKMLTLGG